MLLESIYSGSVSAESYLLSLLTALGLGLVSALVFKYRNSHASQSMVSTLALLPVAVQTVILLVNGNLGVGVAVAGAFSLVRFRSIPGSAREIAALFIAMVVGLAMGTGHLLVAAAFTGFMALATLILAWLRFGDPGDEIRELKITIPETMDFDNVFDKLLSEYTRDWKLMRVRTTHMGSLYELSYRVALKPDVSIWSFMDKLRIHNSNLSIILGRNLTRAEEL